MYFGRGFRNKLEKSVHRMTVAHIETTLWIRSERAQQQFYSAQANAS